MRANAYSSGIYLSISYYEESMCCRFLCDSTLLLNKDCLKNTISSGALSWISHPINEIWKSNNEMVIVNNNWTAQKLQHALIGAFQGLWLFVFFLHVTRSIEFYSLPMNAFRYRNKSKLNSILLFQVYTSMNRKSRAFF